MQYKKQPGPEWEPSVILEENVRLFFRVVAILFCTKENNAPVLHYSSALFCLIPHFLVPSILTGKYWLLEYLFSWPCVFSSRCWTKLWFETIQGLCSLQKTLKIVSGCLAANLFLPCWWPGLQAENIWIGFIMLWPLNFKLLLMVDVKSLLSQFQALCKISEFLGRHFPCQQLVTTFGFWERQEQVTGLFTGQASSSLVRDLYAGQRPGICLALESRARQTWYGCDVNEGCLCWCLGADTPLGHSDGVALLLALFLCDWSFFEAARKLKFSVSALSCLQQAILFLYLSNKYWTVQCCHSMWLCPCLLGASV